MSELKVETHQIKIQDHPNADALEIGQIHGYQSIVRKGQFETGDVVAYIPTGSVLPQELVCELGLEDRLHKGRVRPIRLRGVLSEGLVMGMPDRKAGEDVTEELRITKYEPPIPVRMDGEVFNATGKTVKFDIENIKGFPHVFTEKDTVYVTEKLHGTFAAVGLVNGKPIVTSKGLGSKGLAFKLDSDANEKNLYVRAFKRLEETLRAISGSLGGDRVHLLGEIAGPSVQDLTYGLREPTFFLFDVLVGREYLPFDDVLGLALKHDINKVPLLAKTLFSDQLIDTYVSQPSALDGGLCEGIVVRPVEEGRDIVLGRRILKAVNPNYLFRKGATEYN